MFQRHHRWEHPRIDWQGITLVMIVSVLALVLTTAGFWIALH
jgi:hypothetical protein